jgi:enediyne biosynthesis protein E4
MRVCWWVLSLILCVLAGCAPPQDTPQQTQPLQPASLHTALLAESSGSCLDSFITHDLDHITTTADGNVRMFEANGAGVGIGDLNGNGWPDLVLGNYHGPNTILWNEGNLQFRKEEMPIGQTRAVAVVDVDGDGWLDLVLTRTSGAVNYWRNQGEGRFEQEFLPGFSRPAYAIDWADINGNGHLDAVTASYDAALLTDLGTTFLLDGGGGVYYYENRNGIFVPTALDSEAQALAIALWDVDGDGRLDIMVGNDFAMQDQLWLQRDEGWLPALPFDEISYSTMSYDLGDVENSGQLALFATDMKPYDTDPRVLVAWAPVVRDFWFSPQEDDPQRQENALLLPDGKGGFRNQAYTRRADATGWSWSGVFGDLNADGWLDLYVVNGFIEYEVFGHLPNHELVEENQVLRNDGRGHFQRMPGWGLNSTRSGRGMAMADLDGDGDLDIVVNNLRGEAQLFENRLCGGDHLLVELSWPESGNTRAIGATIYLDTSMGRLRRDVRVTRGYLSSAAVPLHFGLPTGTEIHRLDVHWPDGTVSFVEGVVANSLVRVKYE